MLIWPLPTRLALCACEFSRHCIERAFVYRLIDEIIPRPSVEWGFFAVSGSGTALGCDLFSAPSAAESGGQGKYRMFRKSRCSRWTALRRFSARKYLDEIGLGSILYRCAMKSTPELRGATFFMRCGAIVRLSPLSCAHKSHSPHTA